VRLRDLAEDALQFETAPSPIDGEYNVTLRYRCLDLLWRPVGRLVRFVIVRHPQRGMIILMATDTELDPLQILMLYSHRFKIEVGFKQPPAGKTQDQRVPSARAAWLHRAGITATSRTESRSHGLAKVSELAADHGSRETTVGTGCGPRPA